MSEVPTWGFGVWVVGTCILLVFWRLQKFDKLHIDMELHSDEQGDLQQHELELTNT